jgi:hypothetical protein
MGSAQSFNADLKKMSGYYTNLIRYVDHNKDFKKDTPALRKAICEYLELYKTRDLNKLKDKYSGTAWIWTVHKLHPIMYKEETAESVSWFVDKCIRQYEFNIKFLTIADTYNYKTWKSSYKNYLKICKDTPNLINIPTLEQAFMWHAHMIDNENYVKDCIKILNRFLDNTEVENILTADVRENKKEESSSCESDDDHNPYDKLNVGKINTKYNEDLSQHDEAVCNGHKH